MYTETAYAPIHPQWASTALPSALFQMYSVWEVCSGPDLHIQGQLEGCVSTCRLSWGVQISVFLLSGEALAQHFRDGRYTDTLSVSTRLCIKTPGLWTSVLHLAHAQELQTLPTVCRTNVMTSLAVESLTLATPSPKTAQQLLPQPHLVGEVVKVLGER